MIFPQDFEKRLGFDQLRERLASACLGEPGRRKVRDMSFRTDHVGIEKMLQLVREFVALREIGDSLPLAPYADPDAWFPMLGVGGSHLETADFAVMLQGLRVAVEVNGRLEKLRDSCPYLSSLVLPADTGKKVIARLNSVIDDEEKIRDSASPELARVRKQLKEEEKKARRAADHIMRQAIANGWSAEDAQPTIRDGRLVIPFLAEHKRKVKGYLVDQSATGQTVYLEPADVLEANNDLRDLILEERKEIIRILRELTSFVSHERNDVNAAFALLSELDFVQAKARLSTELEAGMPVLANRPAVKWIRARHPLLHLAWKGKRHLEPLDIELTAENRFLLVSGPNAGGKSVCLKTVGLIQYMMQCGLMVPLHSDSLMGVFDSIFLDIGDQQSIESDLSTYSSHLQNMATFILEGGPRSLQLMDELGSGTDPNFGGGIAQAILEQLLKKQAWGLATTHYYNLKAFASRAAGIRNAAMQFDTDNLAPLFKLEIGTPGSSFALEIATKTGLPGEALKSAERIIGSELIGLETLLKEVADERARLEMRAEELNSREGKAQSALKKYTELNEVLESQRREILNRAKTEASSLLQETNREIEKTIRHIRENKAEKLETRKIREGLRELTKRVKPQTRSAPALGGELKEGDKVRLIGGEVTGTILTLKRTIALVQFGTIRSSVKLERLVRSDQQGEVATVETGSAYPSGTSQFSPQLDVRGMRVEALMPVLMRFIDEAVQFGMNEVSILHGKGEGVLRSVVRDYLKGRKEVAFFRDEHADRGGAGITITVFK